MFRSIMRIFGYIYHLILGLFLLAIASIAGFGSNLTLKLDMLPWEGSTLTYILFIGSLMVLAFSLIPLRMACRIHQTA